MATATPITVLRPRRELLLGCGANLTKQLFMAPHREWSHLTTLDNNRDHKPDVLWNLEELPLPFKDETFDEIHAYEVLEHTGTQGDWRFFFDQFSDFWRILKPEGSFCATVPNWNSINAWGDPSHKRVLSELSLVFLSQSEYRKQVGVTNMSDFRFYYKADFEPVWVNVTPDKLQFVLKAIKE